MSVSTSTYSCDNTETAPFKLAPVGIIDTIRVVKTIRIERTVGIIQSIRVINTIRIIDPIGVPNTVRNIEPITSDVNFK